MSYTGECCRSCPEAFQSDSVASVTNDDDKDFQEFQAKAKKKDILDSAKDAREKASLRDVDYETHPGFRDTPSQSLSSFHGSSGMGTSIMEDDEAEEVGDWSRTDSLDPKTIDDMERSHGKIPTTASARTTLRTGTELRGEGKFPKRLEVGTGKNKEGISTRIRKSVSPRAWRRSGKSE